MKTRVFTAKYAVYCYFKLCLIHYVYVMAANGSALGALQPQLGPWQLRTSRSTGKQYYSNSLTSESVWFDPDLPAGWAWGQNAADAPRFYIHLLTGRRQPDKPSTADTDSTAQSQQLSFSASATAGDDLLSQAYIPDPAVKGTNVPEKIRSKRDYLFSSVPADLRWALQVDEVSLYSITEARLAESMTATMLRFLPASSVVTDATAAVGGNTLSFARAFAHVNAVELSAQRASMLQHNVDLVGLGAKVTVRQGDFTQLWQRPDLRQDAVFMDPPWGGPQYKDAAVLDMFLGSTDVADIIVALTRPRPDSLNAGHSPQPYARFIVLKTPTNYNVAGLKSKLANGRSGATVVLEEPMHKMLLLIIRSAVSPSLIPSSGAAPAPSAGKRKAAEMEHTGLPAVMENGTKIAYELLIGAALKQWPHVESTAQLYTLTPSGFYLNVKSDASVCLSSTPMYFSASAAPLSSRGSVTDTLAFSIQLRTEDNQVPSFDGSVAAAAAVTRCQHYQLAACGHQFSTLQSDDGRYVVAVAGAIGASSKLQLARHSDASSELLKPWISSDSSKADPFVLGISAACLWQPTLKHGIEPSMHHANILMHQLFGFPLLNTTAERHTSLGGKRSRVLFLQSAKGEELAVKVQPWDERVCTETLAVNAIALLQKSQHQQELDQRPVAAPPHGARLATTFGYYRDATSIAIVMQNHGTALTSLRTMDIRVSVQTCVRFLSSLLASLSAIHSLGFLYCDMHPGNILCDARVISSTAQIGPLEKPVLVDFGSMQPMDNTGAYKGLTRGGMWTYQPPEQFGAGQYGEGEVTLTQSSDIYSAAACACYLLTGQPPFAPLDSAGFLVPKPSLVDTKLHPRRQPEALRTYLIAAACADSTDLAEFLVQAMDPNPTKRFQTANEALQALQKLPGKDA
jgi:predicted RNA methylase